MTNVRDFALKKLFSKKKEKAPVSKTIVAKVKRAVKKVLK